jgi:uncharacterized protein (TIGR02599 family)
MFPGDRQKTHAHPRGGFSLLEALVACSILLLILTMLVTMVNQTTTLWSSTTGSVQDFQRSRQAFDILTNRVSQATLNTYWDYRNNASGVPIQYIRQSDLRFRCGPAATLVGAGDASINPGQALFFQAPGGVCVSGSNNTLPGSLNTWGYFVEYGSDQAYRPDFLSGKIPERYRYRLFEMMEPSDQLTIYNYTSGNPAYTGTDWFVTPLAKPANRRIIADNVVAMTLLPKLPPSEDPTDTELSSDYTYDTTGTSSIAAANPKNQLPPLVEIVIVVVDEHSAARLSWTATPPNFGLDKLFSNASRQQRLEDLNTLEKSLRDSKLVPHRFTVTVPLRASKWSTLQTN